MGHLDRWVTHRSSRSRPRASACTAALRLFLKVPGSLGRKQLCLPKKLLAAEGPGHPSLPSAEDNRQQGVTWSAAASAHLLAETKGGGVGQRDGVQAWQLSQPLEFDLGIG